MTNCPDGAQQVRLLICDMSPLISLGIEAAVATNPNFETQRSTAERILRGEHGTPPAFDVIVTERETAMRLVTQRARHAQRGALSLPRIFVIHQSTGEQDIRGALEAGIQGYASQALTLEEFQDGARMVALGMRYLCPRSAQRLADSMTREPLTSRETIVLRELAHGQCNKAIAQELGMALGTVKAHVKALMSKLDAKTRTQVVTAAITRGLVKLDGSDDILGGGDVRSLEAHRIRRPKLHLAA